MEQRCTKCLTMKAAGPANFRPIIRRDKPAFKATCLECERARARARWKERGSHERKARKGDESPDFRPPELTWTRKSYGSYKELNQWLSRNASAATSC
jgi:hypothetical protein